MNLTGNLQRTIAQANNLGVLRAAMERSAEYARSEAAVQLMKVGILCSRFSSGNAGGNAAFEEVNREAHLGAFSLLTYGQTAQALRLLDDDVCEQITAAGQAMQDRAHEHERKFLALSLSPSEVFYDDLFATAMLQHAHERAYLGFDLLGAEDLAQEGEANQATAGALTPMGG